VIALSPVAPRAQQGAERVVRVVVGSAPTAAALPEAGAWVVRDAWGREHARGGLASSWRVERRNRRLRLAEPGPGRSSAWSDEPFVVAPPRSDAFVSWGGVRYRGTLSLVATDTAILIVNVVPLEDYLRGVVPLELGVRSPNESAALEAQAVAARSHAVVRQREGTSRPYDLTRWVSDQVYGGVEVEHPLSDAAVARTAGKVLAQGGRVVLAPYHSTCGGHTAAADEAWKGRENASYLRGVSDRAPGSDRAWCEISPRFRWERLLDRRALDDAVARYVQARGTGMLAGGGAVRGVRIEGHSASGRVASLALDTEGGVIRLTGSEVRSTLRDARGEILNSTYFSLEPVVGRDGRLMQLTLRGAGNGHGVGMCQWGAIGRARAGHDALAILQAYYPGTQVLVLP